MKNQVKMATIKWKYGVFKLIAKMSFFNKSLTL